MSIGSCHLSSFIGYTFLLDVSTREDGSSLLELAEKDERGDRSSLLMHGLHHK